MYSSYQDTWLHSTALKTQVDALDHFKATVGLLNTTGYVDMINCDDVSEWKMSEIFSFLPLYFEFILYHIFVIEMFECILIILTHYKICRFDWYIVHLIGAIRWMPFCKMKSFFGQLCAGTQFHVVHRKADIALDVAYV